MKVHTPYEEYRTFLQEHLPEGIEMAKTKEEAHWLIQGRFTEADYHEGLRGVIIPFTSHTGVDIDFMKKKGLMLFNTTVHAPYVAERALQLTLALLGGIIPYHQNLTRGHWSKRSFLTGRRWTSLYGKRVGLYGYGRIGRAYHDLVRPFGVEVYVIDRGKDYRDAKTVPDLPALVDKSDVVVIAAPLNEHTEGAFDETVLGRMQGKWLINIGRGLVISEKALYDALREGILAGFAGDVWFNYPKRGEDASPSAYPLAEFDNVVMSPHVGGMSFESRKKMQNHVLTLLKMVAKGDFSGALDLERL